MADVTSDRGSRGRVQDPQMLARRKVMSREVKQVREKLTSSNGLNRAFELELVRIFAGKHQHGAWANIGLAMAIAMLASIWTPSYVVGVWLATVVLTTLPKIFLTRRFLAEDPETATPKLRSWRLIFTTLDVLNGLSWALMLILFTSVESPGSRVFVLCALLISGATAVMLSATIPAAVYASLAPVAVGIGMFFARSRDIDAATIAMMAAAAQIFFVYLAHRLYQNALETLESRAEKDALIGELETAKANSDTARRKAEDANLAKSRFLATMSHELRTPLNAILGFSEVMKHEVFGPHASAAYKEYSGDIHSSGQHLLNLINEILDLSRIEAGKYELNEDAVSLAHVAEDCRHMLNLRAKAKSQTIKESIETTLPKIWADERAIRQVMLNILSNAIKFTPEGGEIIIKVGWTANGGQYVSVTDTGPGIPEDEIATVLQSFGRGTHAIKTAEEGSGLGLPIVKGLVDLHGGGFTLKSKLRVGTEVTVTLPPARVMDTLPAVRDTPDRRSA
ncbi:MAG: sensor histidine kinase [Bosea sp. (in: a-proteobacteria)]